MLSASRLWKVSSGHSNSASKPPTCPRIAPWKRNATAHWSYEQLPPVPCSRPAGAGTPERAFAVASLQTWRTSWKPAIAIARIECSVGGLHHEEPRESQLQARSFRRSGRLKPAASDNKAQAQMAAFQKAAQVLSGFVGLQCQSCQAARLRVLSIRSMWKPEHRRAVDRTGLRYPSRNRGAGYAPTPRGLWLGSGMHGATGGNKRLFVLDNRSWPTST
jgi:hypothetical protein